MFGATYEYEAVSWSSGWMEVRSRLRIRPESVSTQKTVLLKVWCFQLQTWTLHQGFARAHFTVSKRAASGETLKMKHAGKNRRKTWSGFKYVSNVRNQTVLFDPNLLHMQTLSLFIRRHLNSDLMWAQVTRRILLGSLDGCMYDVTLKL